MSWTCVAVLGCRDVPAAVDYFADTLGFFFDPETGLFAPDAAEGPVYAIGSRDGVGVHLQIRRRPVFAAEREAIESDAYFYVDDADALFEEYVSKGVTFHYPICDEDYGMRDFAVVDPEGHRLAFGSPRSG